MQAKFFGAAALLFLATACSHKFTVTAECDASSNGNQAYIIDFTTEQPIDSVVVSNNRAVFKGKIDKAHLCQFFVDSPNGESAVFFLKYKVY